MQILKWDNTLGSEIKWQKCVWHTDGVILDKASVIIRLRLLRFKTTNESFWLQSRPAAENYLYNIFIFS